jgi:hypothetical protein
MENNSKPKLKYITGNNNVDQPIFRYYTSTFKPASSLLYSIDGKLKNEVINSDTKYTKHKQVIDEPEQTKKINNKIFDKKYFPTFLAKGDPNDYSDKIDIESEFKIPQYKRYENYPHFKSSDGRIILLENDRRRNLDYSSHMNPGSMNHNGFGNLNEFSKLKSGIMTRNNESTIRDTEIDRFYFTYRNFQHELYGSTPFPEDTRYLNKKF